LIIKIIKIIIKGTEGTEGTEGMLNPYLIDDIIFHCNNTKIYKILQLSKNIIFLNKNLINFKKIEFRKAKEKEKIKEFTGIDTVVFTRRHYLIRYSPPWINHRLIMD